VYDSKRGTKIDGITILTMKNIRTWQVGKEVKKIPMGGQEVDVFTKRKL